MILPYIICIVFVVVGVLMLNGKLLFLVAGYKNGKLNGRDVNEKKIGKVVGMIVILAGIFAGVTPFIF
ncbi:DUF3784 domain-containing protein [Bacillus sp. REN3]|uniref:DUF3784 domain-containing protein n=1 Tax=Bacillus sp. REN3 TaxID=2802440 RepID=UPI001AEE2221|nr:DUF3784 domain-containing protein [Bacillus sp. REN3]